MTDVFIKGPFQKLEDREFDDPDVVKVLAGMSVPALASSLGEPHVIRHLTPTRGNWTPGEARPALASDDPAVNEAMGRCAVYRMQGRAGVTLHSDVHDGGRCAWCEYPLAELLAACDHAVWRMQFVEAELLVWYTDQAKRKGAKYVRPGTAKGYQHPAWRDFWALPDFDRISRIRAAQYPEPRP